MVMDLKKNLTVLRSWNTEFWKFLTNKMFKKCELKVENTDSFKETVLWSLDLWVTYFICLQIGMTQIDAEMYKTFDNFLRGIVLWKIMRAEFRNSQCGNFVNFPPDFFGKKFWIFPSNHSLVWLYYKKTFTKNTFHPFGGC